MTLEEFKENKDLLSLTIAYDINVVDYDNKTQEEKEDLLEYYYEYYLINEKEIVNELIRCYLEEVR